MKSVVVMMGLLVALPSMASAQSPQPPCVFPARDQVKAVVRARVSQSSVGFEYYYSLENQAGAPQLIDKLAIEATTADGRALAQEGPRYWESAGRIRDSNFYVWNIFTGPGGLAAGASAGGFRLLPGDLPTITRFLAWGDAEAPISEDPDSCEGERDILKNAFEGKTIGPKPPSPNVVPLDFLNYLIALVHDSRQQGWIKLDGNQQSLLAKLVAARRALEDGLDSTAKLKVGAFVNEVRATACQDFTCGGDVPLTSEAYALLYYNGRYLYDQLPRPGRSR